MERKLTLEQKAAIEATEHNVLVSAAAGSGKTTVITERLKYLIKDCGVPANTIICITFTRNAADELRTRLSEMGVDAGFIGTIHAFAFDILGAGGTEDGKEFEIYSERHEQMYHKYLIEKYAKYLTYERWQHYNMLENKLDRGEIAEEQVNSFLNMYEEIELNLMNGIAFHAKGNYTQEMVEQYWPHVNIIDLCKRDNVISFDELIKRATDYFKTKGVNIEHILVDEFQDVGQLEYKFIKSLKAKNYYFCGDDYQSIYGFKGAEPKIFLSCSKSKNFKVYKLTKNFRCDQSILNFSNKIIDSIPANEKLTKTVIGNSKELGSTQMISYNEFELIDDIKNLKPEERGSVFVLTRSNGDLNLLKSRFKAAKIDCLTFRQAELSNEEIHLAMESQIIKLLTIHSSKGLEADRVYLVGSFEITPQKWKIESYNKAIEEGKKPEYNLWEEQRIFYVGSTRARHFLKVFNKRNQKSAKTSVVSVESMLALADRDARERKYAYAHK